MVVEGEVSTVVEAVGTAVEAAGTAVAAGTAADFGAAGVGVAQVWGSASRALGSMAAITDTVPMHMALVTPTLMAVTMTRADVIWCVDAYGRRPDTDCAV